jgi:hypothetical protein
MKITMNYLTALLVAALLSSFASSANATPLSGQQLKFGQAPMATTAINGVKYFGHDEASTLYRNPDTGTNTFTYSGLAMVDDFADPFDTPVVHVRWWGSYLQNSINPDVPVDKFLIAFESDVPADQNPAGFSHPGDVLSSQIVNRVAVEPLAPGSGTYFEKKILSPGPGIDDLYEYNAELHLGKEFKQKPGTVYWVKIAAIVDQVPDPAIGGTRWGWHNRDYTVTNPLGAAVTPLPVSPGERDERIELGIPYPTEVWHFQDDAVSAQTTLVVDPLIPNMPVGLDQGGYVPQFYLGGADGPGSIINADGTVIPGIDQFSKDLAFELYTVPEPSTLMLIGIGLAAMVGFRARRRSNA